MTADNTPASQPKTGLSRFAGSQAAILALVLILAFSLLMCFPFATTSAGAPADLFSAERAMAHLKHIAFEPHPAGSPAQAEVRGYLIRQLRSQGWQVETQPVGRFENVIARLPGSDSTGAILLLTHYDSKANSPGAADNGAGTAALLEVARALIAFRQPRNDLILLFDDAEELPFLFAGTRGFISGSPWMQEIKVAISLDTAARGPILVNETSRPNGRMVGVLARVHQGTWMWSSVSGGGEYDVSNFAGKGIQLLALEDNYPFYQQHTPLDRIEIVNPGSLQQMGDQALAITRQLGQMDLRGDWGIQESFLVVPMFGLLHYPEDWSRPLAWAGALLVLAALALAILKRISGPRSLLLAIAVLLASAGLSAALVALIWPKVPALMGWDTKQWPEWPEVVAPDSGWVLAAFLLLGLLLSLLGYLLARRACAAQDVSLAGLLPFAFIGLLLAFAQPRTLIIVIGPVLLGALVWLAGLAMARRQEPRMPWPPYLAAAFFLVHIPALVVSDFMSEGLNSAPILVLVWSLLLFILFPGLEAAVGKVKA